MSRPGGGSRRCTGGQWWHGRRERELRDQVQSAANAVYAPVPGVSQALLMRRFVVVLAGWLGVTTAMSLLAPGSPKDSWFVLMVIAAMLLPPAVFAVGYRRSRWLRAAVLALDFSVITAVQGMRIAGIAMLSLWAAGVLTPAFALWAGGIDVFIGLTAVPLAFLVANRRPVPRAGLRLWHLVGLLDFAVAVPLGIMATPSTLGLLHAEPSTWAIFAFPLSFIPMVGVPFMIIMHVVALLQLHGDRVPVSGPLLH